MLMSEERKSNMHFSSKTLSQQFSQNTIQDTESLTQNFLPKFNNKRRISLIKCIISEKDIPLSNKTLKTYQSFNNSKRMDRNGNEICKNGKQKVTFIDKIANNTLVDIIDVESFKIYNQVEEVSCLVNHNSCCNIS
jgi:hypothetical protein